MWSRREVRSDLGMCVEVDWLRGIQVKGGQKEAFHHSLGMVWAPCWMDIRGPIWGPGCGESSFIW